MILLWLLSLGPALAEPSAIAAGDDIEAWEALRSTPGEDRRAALRAFLEAWPASLLAEAAWVELRELGEPDPGWMAEHHELITRLERSRRTHRTNLEQVPGPLPVAPLDPMGEPPDLSPPWVLGAHGGITFAGARPYATAGLRLGRGPWAVFVRGHAAEQLWGELAARLQPASWRVVWAELGADTTARASGRLGFSLPLAPGWAVEAGAGASGSARGLEPQGRLELSFSGPLRSQRKIKNR